MGLNDVLNTESVRARDNLALENCLKQTMSTFPYQRVFFQPVYGTVKLSAGIKSDISALNDHVRVTLSSRLKVNYLKKHHGQVLPVLGKLDPVHWCERSANTIIAHSLSQIYDLN